MALYARNLRREACGHGVAVFRDRWIALAHIYSPSSHSATKIYNPPLDGAALIELDFFTSRNKVQGAEVFSLTHHDQYQVLSPPVVCVVSVRAGSVGAGRPCCARAAGGGAPGVRFGQHRLV